jgi:biotin operon repressor
VIAGLANVFKGVAAYERGRVLAQAKDEGTTQAELARQLGVSRNAVDDAIKGYRSKIVDIEASRS